MVREPTAASAQRRGAAGASDARGLSALALVAGPMDGLEVVYGTGAAVLDSHDVINLDSADVFREPSAAQSAQALLHLHEQRLELGVAGPLADPTLASLSGVESVRGPAVGLGHGPATYRGRVTGPGAGRW